jgi:hypothetical protein
MFSLLSGRFGTTLKLAQNGAGCILCTETGYGTSELIKMTSFDPVLMFSSVSGRFVIE